jgi:hypothetical protein
MPDDRTIDFVVMFLVIGMVALGLLSMIVGWLTRMWDQFVNRSQDVMSIDQDADERTERTDGADEPSVSLVNQLLSRLEVDRTKAAVIELLVYSDWTTAEIRAVLKGENAAIGAEVDAARKRLGISPPDRQLRVRDERGERMIPLS